ncbi:MAG: hypothetical protein ACREGC_04495 [Minisyncoccia bacterium]
MDILEKETKETVTPVSPETVVKTTETVVNPETAQPDQVVTTTTATPFGDELSTPPQQVIRTTKTVVPGEHPVKVFKKKKTLFRTYQVIWYILVFIEVLLAFRVALKALGANPLSGFAVLIYGLSSPFASPFNGLFGTTVSPQGSVFEWSTIIAAAVYALLAVGLVQLLKLAKPVSKEEVEQTVDEV